MTDSHYHATELKGDLFVHHGALVTASRKIAALHDLYRRLLNTSKVPVVKTIVNTSHVFQINSTKQPAVFLNAGNMFRGNIWFNLLGPPIWASVLGYMGFDAITLNYKEFYRGRLPLEEFFQNLSSSVKVVVCNVDFSNDKLPIKFPISKSLTINRDGVNIGLIGYVDPVAKIRAAPGETITIYDPLEHVKEEAKKLKAEGSQVIIAFGGFTLDLDVKIAQAVPELSLIVTGATSVKMYPSGQTPPAGEDADADYPMKVTRSDGSLCAIAAVFPFGKYLGNVTIMFDKKTWKPTVYGGAPIVLDSEVLESERVARLMNEWSKYVDAQSREVVGTTKVQIKNTREDCYRVQCNGGTLMADAAFDYFSNFETEGTWSAINGAVMNVAASHSQVDERLHGGEIHRQDVYNLYPYEDLFVLMTMQGNTLYKMMEHSVSSYGYGGQFLQISGLRVVYKGGTVQDLRTICTSCRTVKFEKVFRLQWYTIAMPQFIADGGEGFDFSAVPKSLRQLTNKTDIQLLSHYVKKYSPIKTGVDGRLVILEGGAAVIHPTVLTALWIIIIQLT